jgi:hypothetical protein
MATAVNKRSPEQTVRRARTVATQAINRAASEQGDQTKQRSTRTRGAYKIKAEGLDHVARILSGKE